MTMLTVYTTREIKQLSNPACSPQYTVTIPVGTRCKLPPIGPAYVEEIEKVEGGNSHDLKYYYIWISRDDVTFHDWKTFQADNTAARAG